MKDINQGKMAAKTPHFHLTMRVNIGIPVRLPPTRPEDLDEGVMEAVVRSEAVSDLKFRLQQCRANCNLRVDPGEEGEYGEEVASATAEAQARMRIENMKIGSGELREQDLWECGDGDQSPLTHLEYEKLYNSGWGAFSVIQMGFIRHYLDLDDLYRVTHLLADFGWVDLDFECSTIPLGQ